MSSDYVKLFGAAMVGTVASVAFSFMKQESRTKTHASSEHGANVASAGTNDGSGTEPHSPVSPPTTEHGNKTSACASRKFGVLRCKGCDIRVANEEDLVLRENENIGWFSHM